MPLTEAASTEIAKAIIGASITPFNNSNAYIGVGDSPTAFAPDQTDLLGDNKFRKAMEEEFPARDGAEVTFQALFGIEHANFAWHEWGIFNASSAGTMLNRKVRSLGEKTDSQVWRFTVTVSLAPCEE